MPVDSCPTGAGARTQWGQGHGLALTGQQCTSLHLCTRGCHSYRPTYIPKGFLPTYTQGSLLA